MVQLSLIFLALSASVIALPAEQSNLLQPRHYKNDNTDPSQYGAFQPPQASPQQGDASTESYTKSITPGGSIQYGSSHQSSSSHHYSASSYSQVSSSWSGLSSVISESQQQFAGAQISAAVAQQRIQAIGLQFQQAMSYFNSFTEVGGGLQASIKVQMQSLIPTMQHAFQGFFSFADFCKQRFGSQWSSLFQHTFASFSGLFQIFIKRCQILGINIGLIIPGIDLGLLASIGLTSSSGLSLGLNLL